MSNKLEIQQAAQDMVARYGENARREVELRIAELREHGEEEALTLWIEIRKAVIALLDKGSRTLN
jgi:hypothetical protein